MTLASPELVAVDVVTHPDASGGLDNVATVLVELPVLDVDVIASLCAEAPRAVTRRLGWLLDRIVSMDGLDPLLEFAAPEVGDPTPLDVHGSRAGDRDPKWGIIVNADVEEES